MATRGKSSVTPERKCDLSTLLGGLCADAPPSFIVQSEDDPVQVENATLYFLQLKNAKIPAELHIYAEGGHGYSLRRTALPITTWPKLVETWLHSVKMLPAP
jgi:acetyl esterase/lipase